MIRTLLSRRRLLGLLAMVPAAIARPALAAPPEDMATRLAEALARLPLGTGTLSLAGLSEDRSQGETRLVAQVQLSWPPGHRRRRFMALAPEPEAAFQAIIAEIETYFLAIDPPKLT